MPAKHRPPPRRSTRPRGDAAATLRLLAFVVLAALVVRSLLAAPFSIPSPSMLPRLLVGDYLIVQKWPYGWSRHSFPFSALPFSGRIGGAPPARGDVVVFKTPADGRTDYIKRLIGLPGDRIAMRGGGIVLNGRPVPKLRVADFLLAETPNSSCPIATAVRREAAAGGMLCRYRRYREMLPGGRSYDVIDQGASAGDDVAEVTVPAGHYFLMGDNRDDSADSRWPGGRGIGFVPADNLVGRAAFVFFSTDGTADGWRPWGWWAATRRDRIGGGF